MRPLCRYCGKPIPKKTNGLYFGVAPVEAEKGRGRVERPVDKAEAQRFVNGEITSVRYDTRAREDAANGHTRTIEVARYVCQAMFWDGESFVDRYFCCGEHARRFGYFAVENPAFDTKAYADALRAQVI